MSKKYMYIEIISLNNLDISKIYEYDVDEFKNHK